MGGLDCLKLGLEDVLLAGIAIGVVEHGHFLILLADLLLRGTRFELKRRIVVWQPFLLLCHGDGWMDATITAWQSR